MPRATGALFTVLALVCAGAAAAAPATMPRLAGLLPWSADAISRCASGAWVFPVGDSLDFTRGAGGAPGFAVLRGLQARAAEGGAHEGADLGNARSGDPVRAAAAGIVVLAGGGDRGGYGATIVLAHRLDDGALVYTVYAHLLAGSLRIEDGDAVAAGMAIARVGRTGRASTPHLHFEVRMPRDTTLRWERCPVVDPVAFVRARLPAGAGPAWAAPYLSWAELAAFVPRGVDATAPLTAVLFRGILERAGLATGEPAPADTLGNLASQPPPGWNAVARAIGALRTRRLRLPPVGVDRERHAATCAERLGTRRPVRELARLAGREASPTVGEVCLALADLVPPRRARR